MERTSFRLAHIALALFSFCLMSSHFTTYAADQTVRIYHEEVELHPLGKHHESDQPLDTVEGARATLVITNEGAFVSVATRQLTPGHVYSLWFGIYNQPENCKASPCDVEDFVVHTAQTKSDVGYADGVIANRDGTALLNGFIPFGQLKQNWYGNGFVNGDSGEVHLILHHHGPLIPEMASNMLRTYRGGCETKSLYEDFPEVSLSHGKEGPNTCNLLQIVRFVQVKN